LDIYTFLSFKIELLEFIKLLILKINFYNLYIVICICVMHMLDANIKHIFQDLKYQMRLI